METVEQIVSDTAIELAWGNARFGNVSKRDLIANTLLKCACGFAAGYTANSIAEELGLVSVHVWKLTKKGQLYLWAAYSNGLSL